MKQLFLKSAYKKDVKKIAKRGFRLEKLQGILRLLQSNRSLPVSASPHILQGKWEGMWECHIASDWLLIYEITETEIRLVRTGSHSDLFE